MEFPNIELLDYSAQKFIPAAGLHLFCARAVSQGLPTWLDVQKKKKIGQKKCVSGVM